MNSPEQFKSLLDSSYKLIVGAFPIAGKTQTLKASNFRWTKSGSIYNDGHECPEES